MDFNKAFAMRVSELLIANKLSKYKLEKETGLSHSALRYIFNEVNKDLKLSTIFKVCKFFKMELIEFFDSPVFELEKFDV